MEKNKIQIIIFLILIISALAIWLYPVISKKIPVDSVIKKEITDIPDMEQIGHVKSFFDIEKEMQSKRPSLVWTRDPFQLAPRKIENSEFCIDGMILSGIALDEKGKLAMINNEIVREGDIVSGITIKEISDNTVVVEKDGKVYNLKIYKEE